MASAAMRTTQRRDQPAPWRRGRPRSTATTSCRWTVRSCRRRSAQTQERQLDALADLGAALAERLGISVHALWTMRNGYALPSRDGLAMIGAYLAAADAAMLDELRGLLRVGLHADVEVTDGPAP